MNYYENNNIMPKKRSGCCGQRIFTFLLIVLILLAIFFYVFRSGLFGFLKNDVDVFQTQEDTAAKSDPFSYETVKKWLDRELKNNSTEPSQTFANTGFTQLSSKLVLNEYFERSSLFQYSVESAAYDLYCSDSIITVDFDIHYREDITPYDELRTVYSADELAYSIIDVLEDGGSSISVIVKNMSITTETIESMISTIPDNSPVILMPIPCTCRYNIFGDQPGIERILTVKYDNDSIAIDDSEISSVKNELDNVCSKVKRFEYTGEDMVWLICDILGTQIEYDFDLADRITGDACLPEDQLERGLYGALVMGKTVCSGYARAFKAVCDELSVPCWVVTGVSDEVEHSWNVIVLDGVIRYVDLTYYDTGGDPDYILMSVNDVNELDRVIYENCYVPVQFRPTA